MAVEAAAHEAANDPSNGPSSLRNLVRIHGAQILLTKNAIGASPLQLSARNFSRAAWKALVVRQIRASNLSAVDYHGNSCAHYAARNLEHDDVILEVVALGGAAILMSENQRRETPLQLALEHCCSQTGEQLMAYVPSLAWFNHTDIEGNALVHCAARNSAVFLDAVEALNTLSDSDEFLEYLVRKNNSKQTAMHIAMEHCRAEIILSFINTVQNSRCLNFLLKPEDAEGNTCLHVAALDSNKCSILMDTVRLIGKDCLAWLNRKTQSTVLHYALYRCDTETGRALIEIADRELLEMKDNNGDMCLHVAARSNEKKPASAVRHCLQAAVDKFGQHIIYRLNDRLQSALCLSVDVCDIELLKTTPNRQLRQLDTFKSSMLHYLFQGYRTKLQPEELPGKLKDFFDKLDEISRYIDSQGENKLGQNCLHATQLHPKMLAAVLSEAAKSLKYKRFFADLLYSSNHLHAVHTFASKYSLEDIIQPLADISDKTAADLLKLQVPNGANKGATCLHFACETGHEKNIKYLLWHGLRLKKLSGAGQSCIDYAIDHGSLETTEKAVKDFYRELDEKKKPMLSNESQELEVDRQVALVECPDAELLLLIDPACRSLTLPDRQEAQRLLTSVADRNKTFSTPQPRSKTGWRRKRDSEILFKVIQLDSTKILRCALRVDIITSSISSGIYNYLLDKMQLASSKKQFPGRHEYFSLKTFDMSSELVIIDMAEFFNKEEILPELIVTRQFELIPACISLLIQLGPKITKMRVEARGKHATLQQLHRKILSIAVNVLEDLFASADSDEKELLFDYIQGLIEDDKGNKGPEFPYRTEQGEVEHGSIITMIEMADCNELFATDCIYSLAQQNFKQGREPSCVGGKALSDASVVDPNCSDVDAGNSRSFLYKSFSPLRKFWLHCASFAIFTLFFTWYIIDFKRSFESLYLLDIVIILYIASYTLQEFVDMRRRKKARTYVIAEMHICKCPNYFEDVLNYFDLAIIVSITVGLVWKWALLGSNRPLHEAYPCQMVFSAAFGLLMFRWVHFLSYSGVIGPVVSMLWSLLLNDLLPFMAILASIMYSFGVFFFNLLFTVTSADTNSPEYKSSRYGWDVIVQILVLPFNILFAHLEKASFSSASQMANITIGKTAHAQGISVFENVMLFLFMGLVNIVMLNLLIALFNLRISRMANEALAIWRKTYFDMLREYESLSPVPPPLSCFFYIYRMLKDRTCVLKCCNNKYRSDEQTRDSESANKKVKWWLNPTDYPESYLKYLRFQAMQLRSIRPKLLRDLDWTRESFKSLSDEIDNKLSDSFSKGGRPKSSVALKYQESTLSARAPLTLTAQHSQDDNLDSSQAHIRQPDFSPALDRMSQRIQSVESNMHKLEANAQTLETSIRDIKLSMQDVLQQLKNITALLRSSSNDGSKKRPPQRVQAVDLVDAAAENSFVA